MTQEAFNQAVYQGYVVLLLVVSFAAIVQKRGDLARLWKRVLAISPLRRSAAAMLANAAVNAVFVVVSGIGDAALFFILTDAAAARVVLHQPAAKSQALIGAIYMAQIVMHVVYLLSGPNVAEVRYWQILISLAIVQLVVLGGWTVGYHGGKFASSLWRRVAGMARTYGRSGVAK